MGQFDLENSEHFDKIQTGIAETKTNPDNAQSVSTTLVETEKKRVIEQCNTIGVAAFNLITELRKKHNGIKSPDVTQYPTDGSETPVEFYSKSRHSELKKLTEAIKKLQYAFDKAMSSSAVEDFTVLEKIVKENSKQQ